VSFLCGTNKSSIVVISWGSVGSSRFSSAQHRIRIDVSRNIMEMLDVVSDNLGLILLVFMFLLTMVDGGGSDGCCGCGC
jgi:hypothetical protein